MDVKQSLRITVKDVMASLKLNVVCKNCCHQTAIQNCNHLRSKKTNSPLREEQVLVALDCQVFSEIYIESIYFSQLCKLLKFLTLQERSVFHTFAWTKYILLQDETDRKVQTKS